MNDDSEQPQDARVSKPGDVMAPKRARMPQDSDCAAESPDALPGDIAVGPARADLATFQPDGPPVRDEKGRYLRGNPGHPGGSPYVKQIAAWRAALTEAVTVDDIKAVALKLVAAARAGKPWAVEMLLDRCLGRAVTPVTLDGDAQAVKMIMAVDLERV